MKTEPDGDGVRSLSRRAFVVGAGSAVAVGTTGTAAGTEDDGLALTVEATAPYHEAVDERADAFERQGARAPVSVGSTDGTPAERVLDGPADVLVTGAPVAGDGGSRESDLRRAVAVHGWATLATQSDDWRESLRPRTLRSRATADRPVEAWSESDWESVDALEIGDDDGGDAQCAGQVSAGEDRTAIVRGTRAYQYARGRGGAGYYEVSHDDVGAPSATRDRGDDVVPLVRLAHVYVDDASLDRAVTGSFLESYLGHSPPADDLTVDAGPEFDGGPAAPRA